MDLAALRANTRRMLSEVDQDTSFWAPGADDASGLDTYIQRAYEEVITIAELIVDFFFDDAVALRQDYAFVIDCLKPLRMMFLDPITAQYSAPLTKRTIEELDLEDALWRNRVCDAGAIPNRWAAEGQGFYLVPAPVDTVATGIHYRGVAAPIALTAAGQAPVIPVSYHEAICIGAKWRALGQDRTNPDNVRLLPQVRADFLSAVALVKSQHQQKPMPKTLGDVRDHFPQQWRQ